RTGAVIGFGIYRYRVKEIAARLRQRVPMFTHKGAFAIVCAAVLTSARAFPAAGAEYPSDPATQTAPSANPPEDDTQPGPPKVEAGQMLHTAGTQKKKTPSGA